MSQTTTRAPSFASSSAMAAADAAPAPGDDGDFPRNNTRHHLPQTSSAISTIMRSFAHCSSSASVLPSSVEAKPHCGDRQSCSSGMNFAAWSMRRLISSFDSSRAALAGDQAQHHRLVLRHHAQRLEAAGAVAVVFHEEAVDLDLVEQDLLHRLVAAGAHVGRFIIAAAHVHGDGHVGRNVRHRGVDQIAIERAERIRIVAAVLHLLPVFRRSHSMAMKTSSSCR